MPYPKISIRFCTRCKWNLRSAWYLQELLQTFGDNLGEISLIPGETGEFRVLGQLGQDMEEICIWDRKVQDGFPDSKFLKQRVRNLLFDNNVSIGKHNERSSGRDHPTGLNPSREKLIKQEECHDCNDN